MRRLSRPDCGCRLRGHQVTVAPVPHPGFEVAREAAETSFEDDRIDVTNGGEVPGHGPRSRVVEIPP